MVMNLSGQPVIQLAEMQPASQFQLPALPPLIGIQQHMLINQLHSMIIL